MSSASKIIITNNRMDRKSDNSDDEYEEYILAREHDRILSKKEYQKHKAQNRWVEELVQQQVFFESSIYGNGC